MINRMGKEIYYATAGGVPIGPYHPDDSGSQARARFNLGVGVPIYRIMARNYDDAVRKARSL